MSRPNEVVAHLIDGRVVKGGCQDFSPSRPAFHVTPPSGGAPTQVRLNQLKAVFFVRNLAGDAVRMDLRGFLRAPTENSFGVKIAVLFPDGELLCGYSLAYSPRREGFFIFPADPGTNNLSIYVVVNAVLEIREREAAEELARKVLNSRVA